MEFEYIDRTNNITDEDIIDDLLHVKNDILKKNTIKMREYFQHGKYGAKAVRNHFGNWNNLLEKLGIEINRVSQHLSKEDIFNIIYDLWLNIGRQPTMREFEAMTHHTKKIIISNFGKWTSCLKEFVYWANANNKQDQLGIATKVETNHTTSREPSLSLRFAVLKRDNYKCVICGRSPATTPGLELHVDHILPYSRGGETVIDNLQTLCSDCNLGKSDI